MSWETILKKDKALTQAISELIGADKSQDFYSGFLKAAETVHSTDSRLETMKAFCQHQLSITRTEIHFDVSTIPNAFPISSATLIPIEEAPKKKRGRPKKKEENKIDRTSARIV